MRPDPEKIQLQKLIKEVGSLAEEMKTSSVQSVGWYLKSVELQQACLRMRSLPVKVIERSAVFVRFERHSKEAVSHRPCHQVLVWVWVAAGISSPRPAGKNETPRLLPRA